MTFLRKTLALSAAFAVAVALFGALTTTANAQNPPFVAYGTGATADDVVTVYAGSTLCATADAADADGNWGPVQLDATTGDCTFADGDTISFALNGVVAAETETWSAGGAPADAATGTVLTAGSGPVLPPAPLGNAGLAQSTGTGSIAALLLAAFAVVVVAGGRAASRTR